MKKAILLAKCQELGSVMNSRRFQLIEFAFDFQQPARDAGYRISNGQSAGIRSRAGQT
jgi:hypothetical protein